LYHCTLHTSYNNSHQNELRKHIWIFECIGHNPFIKKDTLQINNKGDDDDDHNNNSKSSACLDIEVKNNLQHSLFSTH